MGDPRSYAIERYRVLCEAGWLWPTQTQHRACFYLLRHGMTFGGEFGIENAPEIARAHRKARKAKKRYVR